MKQDPKYPAPSTLVEQVIADVGGAFVSGLGYIGDRLGLFKTLARIGPASAEKLAGVLSLHPRYVLEWLDAMVSAGYVELDTTQGSYSMTAEQQAVLADEASPVFAAGAFQFAIPSLAVTLTLIEKFRSGGGIGFSELGGEVPEAIDRMHRAWFDHQLVKKWLAALPRVVDRLEAGTRVLDVGCGRGRACIAIARAYPASTVVGIDPHGPSIAEARALAEAAGATVDFRAISLDAVNDPERFGLILAIDCIHDMADPVAELVRIRRLLDDDGRLFWSEPSGSADPTRNRDIPGRMRSSLSPYHCLTVSLAEGGAGLGTIIGEEGARRLAEEAGFTRFEKIPIKSTMQQFFLVC